MMLSNLVALTLVELVDRAEQVEPETPGRDLAPGRGANPPANGP